MLSLWALPLLLLPPGEADPVVLIDAPLSGWRNQADDRTSFLQAVHYPASSVNTERASAASLVSGHVAAHAKVPATLVVNGVSMPLSVSGDGTFARPYAFARGSNSVEVRAGTSRARRQFYDAGAGRTPARLRVVLSWDTDGTDVDLHVVTPAGEHAYYGARVTPSGGALDVDVTTGFGPEIFADPTPLRGLYLVYVNYYGSGYRSPDELTVASVAITSDEGTPREKLEVFSVPLRNPGELTLVRSFVYP